MSKPQNIQAVRKQVGLFDHMWAITLIQWIVIAVIAFSLAGIFSALTEFYEPAHIAVIALVTVLLTSVILADPVSCVIVLYICNGITGILGFCFSILCVVYFLYVAGWAIIAMVLLLGPIMPLILTVIAFLAFFAWCDSTPDLPDTEILALDHELQVKIKVADGWTYGETENRSKKTSPYILPWKLLPDKVKESSLNNLQIVKKLRADYEDDITATAEAQWNFRMKCFASEGWDHGDSKDKTNSALLPYNALPLKRKIKIENDFQTMNEIKKAWQNEKGKLQENSFRKGVLAFISGAVIYSLFLK